MAPSRVRIPDHELDRLRGLALDVIGRELPLRRAGRAYKACCPFHAERTASFYVFPDWRGDRPPGFHCFGCGRSGSVFDWIALRKGLRLWEDFRLVVAHLDPLLVDEYACDVDAGAADAGGGPTVAPATRRPNHPTLALPEGLTDPEARACLALAVGHYHALLPGEAAAFDYLLRRGLTRALIAARQLGYAPVHPAAEEQLAFVLRFHGLDATVARRIGLIARDGREFFAGRIVFPEVRDGAAIWANGRAFRDRASGAIDLHGRPKYLGLPVPPGHRKPLVNWQAVQGEAVIGVVEGQMDELALAALGLPAAGLNGAGLASGGNPDLLDLFAPFARLYLFLDRDRAGRRARAAFEQAYGARAVAAPIPRDVSRLGRYLARAARTSTALAGSGRVPAREAELLAGIAARLQRVLRHLDSLPAADRSAPLADPSGLVEAFRADPALRDGVMRGLLEIARWVRPAARPAGAADQRD